MKVVEPYLVTLHHPFKVKVMYGCTALHEPMDPEHRIRTLNQSCARAVGEFWMNSWLPDCAAPERPDECMNLKHEGDWRAFVQDCYALEQYYKEKGCVIMSP